MRATNINYANILSLIDSSLLGVYTILISENKTQITQNFAEKTSFLHNYKKSVKTNSYSDFINYIHQFIVHDTRKQLFLDTFALEKLLSHMNLEKYKNSFYCPIQASTNLTTWIEIKINILNNSNINEVKALLHIHSIDKQMLSQAVLNSFIKTSCNFIAIINTKDKSAYQIIQNPDLFLEFTNYTPSMELLWNTLYTEKNAENNTEELLSEYFNVDKIIEHLKTEEPYIFTSSLKQNNRIERFRNSFAYIDKEKKFISYFSHDITNLYESEMIQKRTLQDALTQAEHANMIKSDFLSRMSHEIRTPLNAVIGYMTIAQNANKNTEKILECIEKSDIAAKHLLSIVNDVLDISSLENGKTKIHNASFDIKSLVSTVSTVYYNLAKSKNIKFEATIDNIQEEFLIGDQVRVNQILMNLLSNAVKFTKENGSIKLNVSQTMKKKNIVFVRFTISDTGIGISDEYKTRLFKPFEQQDAAIFQNYGGTGLGLSICKSLITMMKGSISLDSTVGKGSTFTVEIPFDIHHQSSESLQNKESSFPMAHTLVVDDDQGTRDYMEILLKRYGVRCDIAASGKEAIELTTKALENNDPYNLCLLDWKMPQMDGLKTVEDLRKIAGVSMPMIIVTAYDFSEIENEAQKVGITKLVLKPLFQSTVLDLLLKTFGKYKVPETTILKKVIFEGKRILLAEDNEMNREIAVDLLSPSKLIIDTANDGQKAVDLFCKSKEGFYSAILMDIQMPILSGYEATTKIRQSEHPQAKTIPIIAMTANAFSEDIAMSLSMGMNDHIAKPIDPKNLLAILNKYLKN